MLDIRGYNGAVWDLLRHQQRQKIAGLRASALMPSQSLRDLRAGHRELLRKIGERSEKRTWITENTGSDQPPFDGGNRFLGTFAGDGWAEARIAA